MFTILAIAPSVLTVVVALVAALVGSYKSRQCAARTQRLAALDLRAKRRWQRATMASQACLTYSCPVRVREDYWASERLGAALLAEIAAE